MASLPPFATHEVLNQSPPFADINLFATDTVLREAVEREGGGFAKAGLDAFGAICGSREALEQGRLANEVTPRLRSYDEKGRRLDIVEYHPAYHWCMQTSFTQGLHSSVWEHLATPGSKPRSGAHVARCAGSYMAAQMETGHCCPVTMTNAVVATLKDGAPGLLETLLPKILSRRYDPRFLPVAAKTGITIGMGMTEKQGGSDVRANTTRAEPVSGGANTEHRLTGHKWFLSAPMCDAFLVLAQAPKGLSCFYVPRVLADGSVNPLRLQRLKEKLGNRSNASSEIELAGATGFLVGEEGRGVATIIEMVTLTRLDCIVSSAGLMRLGAANAILHARHRKAFGRTLLDQPMMEAVLADLALEVEGATALAFRLARAFDHESDAGEGAFRRLMTPVIKYFVCKVGPQLGYEAMECLGGNGYVEEGLLARAYRELPVNAIWEGSGNIMAHDVLRVLMKEPRAAEAVIDGLAKFVGRDKRLAAALERVREPLHRPRDLELNARGLLEGLATVVAAALLRASAPPYVADAYLATRLEGGPRRTFGQGLSTAERRKIIDRAFPA